MTGSELFPAWGCARSGRALPRGKQGELTQMTGAGRVRRLGNGGKLVKRVAVLAWIVFAGMSAFLVVIHAGGEALPANLLLDAVMFFALSWSYTSLARRLRDHAATDLYDLRGHLRSQVSGVGFWIFSLASSLLASTVGTPAELPAFTPAAMTALWPAASAVVVTLVAIFMTIALTVPDFLTPEPAPVAEAEADDARGQAGPAPVVHVCECNNRGRVHLQLMGRDWPLPLEVR